jgi:hypothetical protein
MKTNKHITLSLAVLLLLLALLSACNADASAGLFRQIADSQAPIGIVYRQLLGLDTIGTTTTLYYRTNEGIYKTDLNTRTQMKASVAGEIIQAAYYAGSGMVQYITNDSNTVKNTTDSTVVTPTDTTTIATNDALKIKNLYANGLVMVQGEDKDIASKIRYSLVQLKPSAPYDVLKTSIPYHDGYSLASVLQMTGFENEAVSTTYPIIISMVDLSAKFKHFYYDASNVATDGTALYSISGLEDERITAFHLDGTKQLFALTSDGELYKGTVPSPLATITMSSIYDGSKTYDTHAYLYGVTDSTGTTHLISKTATKAEDLFVYSVDASNNVTTASIDEGYAKYLANADIVSALYVDTNLGGDKDSLLVATNDNGLFKIEINHAFANINSIANGSSTKSEEYNFDLF